VDNGIDAKYILSKAMPDTDGAMSGTRGDVIKQFETGSLKVLLNVDILGVGYNNPGIQTVILDIATESYPNYSQKAARGGRPASGKAYYTLLDFGENVQKFGSPEFDRTQVLWHNELKGGGIASTKECPECKRLIHLSYRVCPFCGHRFLTEKEIYEVELVRIADQVTQPGADKNILQAYVAKCILEGRSTNWILMNVCIKNSQNPKKAFMEAIEIMRTKHGKSISPQYWYFFKKNILKNKLKK
jgi:DNA or RNA helicases of superfamily II